MDNHITNFTSSEEHMTSTTLLAQNKQEVLDAKTRELNDWKDKNVYTEVDDVGQEYISLRWVIKSKVTDGTTFTKARLCARGFEEQQNFRTDSPTCSREGNKAVLSIIASKKWTLNSLDVKTAFLQGNVIERTVHVKPPKEHESNKLWKLNKCVYGLADANRYWYLKVKEELTKLKFTTCKLDQSVFLWFKDNKLIGTIGCFVDDLLWGGEPEFETVIDEIRKKFQIGKEFTEAFTYLGMNLKQNQDKSIIIDQDSYIASIEPIAISSQDSKEPSKLLSEHQKSLLRGLIGQLNWIAGITRPEIRFQVSEISTRITKSTIKEIKDINKVVQYVKTNRSFIKIPQIEEKSLHIKVYADASYGNLHDGGSQGGFIVLLCDDQNNSSPIAWNSTRIKRVVRSTLAAETLSCTEACDTALYISNLIKEFYPNKHTIKVHVYTDCKSLLDASRNINQVTEKKTPIELSSIREMINNDEIQLHQVSSQNQLADIATKKGPSTAPITECLQEGQIPATR